MGFEVIEIYFKESAEKVGFDLKCMFKTNILKGENVYYTISKYLEIMQRIRDLRLELLLKPTV